MATRPAVTAPIIGPRTRDQFETIRCSAAWMTCGGPIAGPQQCAPFRGGWQACGLAWILSLIRPGQAWEWVPLFILLLIMLAISPDPAAFGSQGWW